MRSRTWGKDGGVGGPSGTLNVPLATFRDSRLGQRGGKGRRAMGMSYGWAASAPVLTFDFASVSGQGLVFNTEEFRRPAFSSAQLAQVVTDCVPASEEPSREPR